MNNRHTQTSVSPDYRIIQVCRGPYNNQGAHGEEDKKYERSASKSDYLLARPYHHQDDHMAHAHIHLWSLPLADERKEMMRLVPFRTSRSSIPNSCPLRKYCTISYHQTESSHLLCGLLHHSFNHHQASAAGRQLLGCCTSPSSLSGDLHLRLNLMRVVRFVIDGQQRKIL